MTLEDWDQRSLIHPFTDLRAFAAGDVGPPRIIQGGHGARIRDQNDRELIDAFAGLYCVNVGYGRTEIADAIYEQARKLAYFHVYAGHSNEPAIRLSERLLSLAPENMRRVYFGLSGSDANETQIKIVWYYNNVLGRPRKKKIISRWRGYHGGTVISGSLTGLPIFHRAFDLPVGPILHTTVPHHYREAADGMSERQFSRKCAEDLEALIVREDPETVAAFIGEPVLGTGGIIPPPEGYWDAIQPILKKYDILLIADEVVCGFGRLGADFGSYVYGIEPDLMTIAKGLTSAYQPLSGVLVGDRVWQVLMNGSQEFGPFAHGYTYSAHPVGAAAAMANLDIVQQEGLAANAARVGTYFRDGLQQRLGDHPLVGEVRGAGLLAAVEFMADKQGRIPFDPSLKVGPRISARCAELGLIARAMPHGDILGFAPPLVIDEGDCDQIIEISAQAATSVLDELVRDGTAPAG